MSSFTEENYLKIIYNLSAWQEGEVSTNALAEQTQTRAASVTDMLRKLADKNLIHYKKYQGVRLTPEGERVALQVIRKHRLWEVFLVDKLGFGWDEVHPLAEELEHINSEKLIQKLDAFLGHPSADPHGDPIPDPAGRMPHPEHCRLTEVVPGQAVVLVGVTEHSAPFLQFLDRTGLTLGCRLEVVEVNAFDGSVQVGISGNAPQFVSQAVARNLLVS
ncbi:MAG: metal-dependent transcriptional regulator [Cytophagaceae bacterium]|nr:metal-dependent transcriptional regulator [Cytophagaceae bacterium]